MKKLYVFAAIIFIAVCIYLLNGHLRQVQQSKAKKVLPSTKAEIKYDGPDKALEQEIRLTKDPFTGVVPTERLEAARAIQLQRFSRQQSAHIVTAVPGVNWTERGPDNVGGRTRAMLFDVNDPTYSKVWAGGVGGGLWYTNDITAAVPAWNKVNDAFDNLAVTCIAQFPYSYMGNIMYFGTGEGWYNGDAIRGNGIFKSTNGGITWTQLPSTVNNPDFYYVQRIVVLCCANEPVVMASTRTGGVQISNDGGASWSKILGLGAGGGGTNEGADLKYVYNYVFATMGLTTGGGGIYRYNTGDHSWTNMYNSQAGEGRIELAANPNGYQHLYALVTRNDLGDSVPIKKIMRTDTSDGTNIVWYTIPNPPRCSKGNTTTDFTNGHLFY
jgi:hypothetical protein